MRIPFLSKLFRTRDKPKDWYSGTDFRYLFGPTTSGKAVNEFTAIRQLPFTLAYGFCRKPWLPFRFSFIATRIRERNGSIGTRFTGCFTTNPILK